MVKVKCTRRIQCAQGPANMGSPAGKVWPFLLNLGRNLFFLKPRSYLIRRNEKKNEKEEE